MAVNNKSWANLPPDLLLFIVDFVDVTTIIRLSTVCMLWASTMRPCLPPIRHDQPIPWLLCSAQNSNTNPNGSVFTFYDLSTDAYFSVHIPIPSLGEHHWMGYYEGWLITLDQQRQLHLIKPLTGTDVLLPSNGIKKEDPRKVILYQCPDNNNELRVLCLTQTGRLLSTKLGDKSWTWIIKCGTNYHDIVVHQGKVYALSKKIICCCDLRSFRILHMFVISFVHLWSLNYLLEWNDELVMMIINYEEREIYLENERITLYKIKNGDRPGYCSLTRVLSIGGDALFFGANCRPYVVSSSGRDDIQGNCIYDAETSYPSYNFGAYDLGKNTYKKCCPLDSPMHFCAPIWFWPC